ncbi:hypothetical protein SAMN02799643_02768 [Methylobacterium sp. UNCCL125]|nr:hypothetical protein SAMN02799643_02768 [Methylobacterium sp. UNCCL125]
MDPFIPAWLRSGLSSVGRMMIPIVKRVLSRRGAEQGLPSRMPEFTEALDLLAGGDGVVGRTITGAKAWATDVPSAFREERFQRWARDAATRDAFSRAAIRQWQDLELDQNDKKIAIQRYSVLASDARQRAERPFDDAVTFLVLSVRASQSTSERVADEKGNADRNVIVNAITEQGARFDATISRVLEGGSLQSKPNQFAEPSRTPDELADASGELLSWPGDINGKVITRPELDDLEEQLLAPATAPTGKSILLFGSPGSGKSALLAALGNRLRDRGGVVLGIKADTLPATVSTVADLGPELDLGTDIVKEIAAQATNGPVYVLIDQLDAVASLIDGSGGRLRALGNLARRLRTWPEIRVVASVRPFEFAADGGFRANFPENSTVKIELALPELERVHSLLAEIGINPLEIPAALSDVIRIPQALRDIVAARRDGFAWSAMTTWRSTQVLRFERLVAVNQALHLDRLIDHLVTSLRFSGTLWTAADSLPIGSSPAVNRLCAEGILRRREEAGLIGFAHQTWAETLDARLALSHGDLISRVTEAGRNLLARPQALAILRYARDAAPAEYDASIRALWARSDLRRHLRHLILDLAAGGDASIAGERHIVLTVIAGTDAALADRALRLTAGNSAWFEHARSSIADRMTSNDDTRTRSVWQWLSAAAANHAAEVLTLLDRHWRGHQSKEIYIPHVLENLGNWDDRAFDLFCAGVNRVVRVDALPVWTIRQQVKAGRHDVAAKLIGLIFDRVVALVPESIRLAQSTRAAGALPEEGGLAAAMTRLQIKQDGSFSYQLAKLLGQLHGMHDFPDIVRQAPGPYIASLLPRFSSLAPEAADDLDEEDFHELQTSNRQETRYDLALVEGLRAGLEELAKVDKNEFTLHLSCVGSQHKLLDRLFASAMTASASTTWRLAIEFLEADTSRLKLGDRLRGGQSEAMELVRSISAHCDAERGDRLVALIMAWNEHSPVEGSDVQQRRALRRINRQLRVRLLAGLDISRFSSGARRTVQEELRAIPEDQRERSHSSGGWVRSPMSTEMMERATDRQLLKLFAKLPDGKERWQSDPSKFLIGGSREASMAFGELAKRQPTRAKRLLQEFSPETHQVPVGAALRALSETKSVDPTELLELLSASIQRGFDGDSFRRDAVWTLYQIADRVRGLEDHWISMLVSWLEPPNEAAHGPTLVDTANEDSSNKPLPTTVLFGGGRLRFVSGGENSTILRVCTLALLRRVEPAYDQWLELLEAHLVRPERSSVWADLSEYLVQLAWANQPRASVFILKLLRLHPDFRDSEDGARLVARLLRILPSTTIEEVLEAWRFSEWALSSVAIGEIEALRTAFFEPSLGAEIWPTIAATGPVPSDVMTGVANVAVVIGPHEVVQGQS